MRVAKTIELDAHTERELRVLSQRKRIRNVSMTLRHLAS